MTLATKMIIEIENNNANVFHEMHELVLEALNDAGIKVFFMSTENITNSENMGENVAEYWSIDGGVFPFTDKDTDEEI